MSAFSGLEIGKRALLAQRIGMDATANNIANVNTPNYTRQRAVFAETTPNEVNGIKVGSGVSVLRLERVRQDFFDREVRNNTSQFNSFATDSQIIDRIEAILAESSDSSLDETIKSFFNAVEDLSLRPESLDRRNIVLNAAQSLAGHFNGIGASLINLRQDVKLRADTAVGEVNRILSAVAELNGQIRTGGSENEGATIAADQRANLLEELSALVNIRVNFDSNNQATVSIGSNTIVSSTVASQLDIVEESDPVTLERTLTLVGVNEDGDILTRHRPTGGELASSLKNYNVTLDGFDSSGGFSLVADLNSLADELVEQINAISATGFGLDDAGPDAPGRNIFTPGTTAAPITADNISVSSDILNAPRDIPTSNAANQPGNNAVVSQIANLLQNQNFFNNASILEFYTSTITQVGALGSDARNGADSAEQIGNQVIAQREAVNGVNLDEEAVNLIKFQRAFEASARIINTTDEMLQVIVNLGL